MFELDERALASFRVKDVSLISYRAISMDADQKIARCRYMRRILRNASHFHNASNDRLDQILIFRIEEGYIVQDELGRDFFLPGSMAWGTVSEGISVQQTLPLVSNGTEKGANQ